MRDLNEMRADLDAVDRQIVALFERRMAVSREIAAYKRERGLPVRDAAREEQVIATRKSFLSDPSLGEACGDMMRELMRLSRQAQDEWIKEADGNA